MIDKKEIQKINDSLRHGDKKEIEKLSGFSAVTLNKFFGGNEELVSDEAALKIVEAAAIVIKQRNAVKKATNKIINSL